MASDMRVLKVSSMKPYSCVTCGKACEGRQCRACYTSPKEKKQKALRLHEWAYIYELLDPDTKQVRYVGCSEHPQRRLNGHLHNAWKETSNKDRWLRSLSQQRKSPILKVVKKVPYQQRRDQEQDHIQTLLESGADLLNMVVRGEKRRHGKYIHSNKRCHSGITAAWKRYQAKRCGVARTECELRSQAEQYSDYSSI
jgi:hypothetical protein